MRTQRGLVRTLVIAANNAAYRAGNEPYSLPRPAGTVQRKTHARAYATRGERGFTLIEILIVIGLIAVLAAVVLIAINPARQFALGRDSQRVSNLNAIINAIGQRMADNRGQFEGTVTGADGITRTCGPLPTVATTSITSLPAADASTPTGNLGCLVPTYIPALPSDPSAPSGAATGYEVRADGAGRVWVSASTKEPTIPRNTDLYIVR